MRNDTTATVAERRNEALPAAFAGRGEPEWMRQLRRRAWERFLALDWPTPQEEEWRRTDLSRLELDSYLPAATDRPAAAPSQAEDGYAGFLRLDRGAEGTGWLREEVAARGVRLLPLRRALTELAEPLEELFARGIEALDNRLQAWHYALWSHGAVLYVPPFVEVAEPLLISLNEQGEGSLTGPHIVVLLEEGARATVESRLLGEGKLLCNAALELRLGPASALRYHELQDLADGALYFRHGRAEVNRDASLTHTDASLGASLTRSRLDCDLSGPGAEAHLNGVYFSDREQHLDIRTVQRHLAPQAVSRAYYKGAVQDAARTVYQGLIEVCPGAARTDAYLSNKNLILNDGARADSIPSLRIENNDVRCTHGSTTGRIDADQLFYLMSRGLSPAEARDMLVVGFFEDVLDRSPAGFRDHVLRRVHRRLLEGRGGDG